MGVLSIRCPKTGQSAPTGIDTEYESLVTSWDRSLSIDCFHCGETHDVKIRDAFIAAAISDEAIRGLTDEQVQKWAERMTGVAPRNNKSARAF